MIHIHLYGSVTDCQGLPVIEGTLDITYFGMNGGIDELIEITDGTYSWTTNDCAINGISLSYIDNSGQVTFQSWLPGLFESETEFNITTCDTLVGGVGTLSFVADSINYMLNDLIGFNTGYGIAVVNSQTQNFVFGIQELLIGETIAEGMILEVGNITLIPTSEVVLNLSQIPNGLDPTVEGTFTGEFTGSATGVPIDVTGEFSIPVF